MVKRYLYHVCCHGNHCTIRTTLILKTRYALCIACFIKQFVNSCLLHSLCSSIDVKLQETHRISRILVLPSFHYSDLKTLRSSTSKRHQQFYDVILDCINCTPFNVHIFAICKDNLFKFSGNTQRNLVFHM